MEFSKRGTLSDEAQRRLLSHDIIFFQEIGWLPLPELLNAILVGLVAISSCGHVVFAVGAFMLDALGFVGYKRLD
eukprot:TRINITY_DN16577_c0_g1_i1.p1 TRINITY_DN16577_c0_g1~~TRINITY_DN16577_c0_g1_i1.p1  ORF type:complete len:75 (+),score=13.18 TRINITY_DN16577_c0_g1_i1:142-366(+)